jgi:hypothetical protein
VDPVVQEAPGAASPPSTSQNFEGISSDDQVAALGVVVLPPDTTAGVGPNHIVQWVNISFAVYSKTGVKLYGPAAGNTLWQGFGGPCETQNDGDPIVRYDRLADRWLMSQLAVPNFPDGPFYQCIAVSKTGDPLGQYYRYAFVISDTLLNDYPKFGVWPDGYYMAVNHFSCYDAIPPLGFISCDWAGQGVYAFQRDLMLQGLPAPMVGFRLDASNLGGMLPSDLDGPPPPAGTPNHFVQVDDDAWLQPNDPWGPDLDRLQVWAFQVDWASPLSSTFSQATVLQTEPFDSNMCGYSPNCIPQPGVDILGLPSPPVDALADRLMYRLQYRNFGSYQTLVTNHTVDVNGADHAGIRWYELRDSGTGWTIQQQGTYAPADTIHRWMGSIATDQASNMALGFSAGNLTTSPSIRYVGRQAGDSPGQLGVEDSIVHGTGYQLDSSGRWGDYSTMNVDPSDDCTFWYTQEYYQDADIVWGRNWQTRIASFKFANCGTPLTALSVNDVSVTEGDAGTTAATFTVRLAAPSSDTVTVQYATADGIATAGSDYTATSGTLTFDPGETSQPVTVQVTGDATAEANETFLLNLSSPTSATIADGQGVGTIMNDDLPSGPDVDLVETSVSDPPATLVLGDRFPVTDTAMNQGTGPAGPSTTRYYLSPDTAKSSGDTRLGGERSVPALSAGASSTGTVEVEGRKGTPSGRYFLLACADDRKNVAESDERNNCTVSATQVRVMAPDLVEAAVSDPPALIAIGGNFSVTDTVENQGDVGAGASTTRYYLSLDTKRNPGDRSLIGARSVPSLVVGATSTGAATVEVPATAAPGLYYVLACADDRKKVAESNEKNNCAASAAQVTVGP